MCWLHPLRFAPSVLVTLCCSILASSAYAQDAWWLVTGSAPGQFADLGELGEASVSHVELSFQEKRPTRSASRPEHGRRALTTKRREPCGEESYLTVMPDLRSVPSWMLSEFDGCKPEKKGSRLWDLVPRISIQGSFFNVGYEVELDKETKGLYIDYGAFTLGIGDSPSGGVIFNGATFGYPQWLPGRRLLPESIREELKFDLGLMLPIKTIDTIDITEWNPHFGIGVRVVEW